MPSLNQSSSNQQSTSRSTSGTKMVPGMLGVYNQLLKLNQNNYQNVLGAYSQAQNNTASQLQNVYGGYQQIEQNIMGALGVKGGGWGVAAPAAEAIRRQGAQTQGQTQQSLVNAGLGNTSVLAAMSNQNMLNTQQAYGGLGSQLAQTAAGYMGQLGMARQGAMMQGIGMQSGLAGQYMGDLAGYRFANTAGSLTGSYGNSQGQSQGTSQGYGLGVDSPMGGGGRGGGGGGGNSGILRPFDHPAGAGIAPGSGYGDISAGGGFMPAGAGSSYVPQNIGYTPTPESMGGNWAGMSPESQGGGYDFGNPGYGYSRGGDLA